VRLAAGPTRTVKAPTAIIEASTANRRMSFPLFFGRGGPLPPLRIVYRQSQEPGLGFCHVVKNKNRLPGEGTLGFELQLIGGSTTVTKLG